NRRPLSCSRVSSQRGTRRESPSSRADRTDEPCSRPDREAQTRVLVYRIQVEEQPYRQFTRCVLLLVLRKQAAQGCDPARPDPAESPVRNSRIQLAVRSISEVRAAARTLLRDRREVGETS